MMHTTPAKLEALTGLRFFAAASIVLFHLQGQFGMPTGAFHHWPADNAVSLFFVLSGFILTYVYPSLEPGTGTARFWVARFARVWPAHLVSLLLVCLLLTGFPNADQLTFWITNLLLVQAWIPLGEFFFSYNAPSWSISTEVFFYLIFPFLIANFSRTWIWKLLGSFCVAVGLIVMSELLQLRHYDGQAGLSSTALVYIHPLARTFEFTLGMATALLWMRVRHRLTFGIFAGTLIEIGALACIVALASPSFSPTNWVLSVTHSAAAAEWMIEGGATCLGSAFLIFVLAMGRGWISAGLGIRPIVFLGEISFSLYMLHQIGIRLCAANPNFFASWPNWMAMSFFLAGLVASAAALWWFFEKPARSMIVNMSLVRRRATSPQMPQ